VEQLRTTQETTEEIEEDEIELFCQMPDPDLNILSLSFIQSYLNRSSLCSHAGENRHPGIFENFPEGRLNFVEQFSSGTLNFFSNWCEWPGSI